jgi:hypothetical protein
MTTEAKFDSIAMHDGRGLEIIGHINMLRVDCLKMSRSHGVCDGGYSEGAGRHFNERAEHICDAYRLTNGLWHAFCRMANAQQESAA